MYMLNKIKCEIPLIKTFHNSVGKITQFKKLVDVAIMGFSKAFHTVTDDAFLNKIKHYSVVSQLEIF